MWSRLLTVVALAHGISAQNAGGTGPFRPATHTTAPTLPNHTIYHPTTAPNTTLPVLLWGNGACSADGTAFLNLLTQLASHGVFVIASGAPSGKGSTTSAVMKEGLEWIGKLEGGVYNGMKLALDRVGVAGQSCGGVEAYDVIGDKRVGVLGVFNSGLMTEAESKRVVPGLGGKKVFYFLGGKSDIAYANGERDYTLLPAGTPSWKGNLPVGHGGTYGDKDAGKFGVAAVHFVNWLLRGNATSASFFTTGNEAKAAGWEVESKNLDAIKVTPI
ncbi:hypothetical protein C8A05DRAFT_37923 [Staphylotrichum tortipilum]|uniref:Uncharacterized protein n=1 Tax=Staphylotrichum tortipilum TaxID=2831512 RepID=A0AAN6ME37_9PEZI|nr:hypothetical protein C8A05DRAFT_37923 [Staphylotrichum longicolle]